MCNLSHPKISHFRFPKLLFCYQITHPSPLIICGINRNPHRLKPPGLELLDAYEFSCFLWRTEVHSYVAGEDTMLSDQPYRYLTVDEMKSLGDDSLPIDVTRDERVDSNRECMGKYIIFFSALYLEMNSCTFFPWSCPFLSPFSPHLFIWQPEIADDSCVHANACHRLKI